MEYIFISYINHFDAQKVESILINNEVSFLFKTPHDSSIMAGWVSPGSSFNEKSLFVEKGKLNLVNSLLSDYLK
mgnify:CR=1 FL=1